MGHDLVKNCSHSPFLDSSEWLSRLSQFELLLHSFVCSFTKCASACGMQTHADSGDALMNKPRFLPFMSSIQWAIVLYHCIVHNVLYISSRQWTLSRGELQMLGLGKASWRRMMSEGWLREINQVERRGNRDIKAGWQGAAGTRTRQ